MPKQKTPPAPLSAADRDELLRALRAASEPLDAAQTAKLAKTSRRPSPAEAADILREFVAKGAAHDWPAKTAKGKPRFWDRDLKTSGEAAARDLVQQSPEPVSAKDVKKLWKLPFKLSDAEIATVLEALAQKGTIYEIPAKTAKSGVRYWHGDAIEFGRICLLTQVAAKPPQSKVKLKSAVKWLNAAGFEELLERLIARKEIYRHPPLGKSAQPLWGGLPPAPEPYLTGIRDQLAAIVSRLQSASIPAADLRRAAVQMLESAGISFGAAASPAREVPSVRNEEVIDLVQLMQALEPGADRGALVTARQLRKAANLSKPVFDALALQFSREGRIVLHEHDFPSSLSPADREELVTDGQGNFYVGMAIRPQQRTA